MKKDLHADSDTTIARRLAENLRVTREDEAKLLRIIESRQLRRRAQRVPCKK